MVSVIIPVYNGYPEIIDAVESVLWQTYPDWECIIVNDGSTDGTKNYLDSLTDTRFKITHLEKNGGRGNARQEGLKQVEGEYIAFLDADDWYAPEKLQEQVDFLECNPNVDLISGPALSYGTHTDITRIRGKGDNSIHTYNGAALPMMIYANIMLRRSAVTGKSYNVAYDYGEDMEFIQRCLLNKNYALSDKVLYYYNEFDSITVKKMRKAHLEILKREKTCKQLLKYLFWYFIAPIVGSDFRIKRRGGKPSNDEINRFEQLFRELRLRSAAAN